MNTASIIAIPGPCSADLPEPGDFLSQCADLGKDIFARLRAHIQSPPDNRPESTDTTIRELDSASRILKRLQETYLIAQKEMAAEKACSKAAKCSAPVPSSVPESAQPSNDESLITAADGPAAAATVDLPPSVAPDEPAVCAPYSEEDPNALSPSIADQVLAASSSAAQSPALPAPSGAWPLPKSPNAPFRPPQTRNRKKAARRKSKGKH